MYAYVDEQYTIADECIFAYSGNEEAVRVPTSTGDGHPLSAIGKGAYYGAEQMKKLTITNGIESVGDYAFKMCSSLEEVIVAPTVVECGERPFQSCRKLRSVRFFLDLMEDEMKELTAHSFALSDGRFLIADREEKLSYMHAAYEMTRDMGIRPVGIRPEMETLFLVRNVNVSTGQEALGVSKQTMTFAGCYVGNNEKDIFLHAADPKKSKCVDSITEGLCDMMSKLGEQRLNMLEESVFLTFGKPEQQNGIYRLMIDARKSFCFFQSAQPVTYGGEKYYIYCRNFPTNDETCRYYRQEAEVLRADGGYVPEDIRKSVYAKYKLITGF
ncbi:MAG: leucine-rich repeat protein [Lachnospiraceae bacterium]|nr:leucine-rich repeat protein [Lachnospiraceae bacterium]